MKRLFRRYMYPLLESIYLCDGVFRNLPYHEARMRIARIKLFNCKDSIDLHSSLSAPDVPPSGLFKTRIVYDTEIRSVEFVPYTIRPVKSLRLIHSDTIDYGYKFVNRSALNSLFEQRDGCDDILIVKNGFITDTSYANVIFRKNDTWYTPKHCLLHGTMRQFLLDTGQLHEVVIDCNNYLQFESFKLINSMLGTAGEEIPVTSIR